MYSAASPVDLVLTVTVDAGVAEALVDLREAGGVVVTFWTRAGEAVDAVDAGAAIVAGVDGTLVDVDVTHGAYKKTADDLFYFLKSLKLCNLVT